MSGKTPPTPVRGAKKSSGGGDDQMDEVDTAPVSTNVQDLIPRTNISSQITSSLISELSDKNWKVS